MADDRKGWLAAVRVVVEISGAQRRASPRRASRAAVSVRAGRGARRRRLRGSAARLRCHCRTLFTEIDTPSRSGTIAVVSCGCDATRSLYSAIARVSAASRCGAGRKPGTTSPSHSTLSVTSSPPGRSSADQPIQQRRVELLVAVLKDQIEWAGHFRDLPLRVADDDADAIGDSRRARNSRAPPAPARGPSPSSTACRPAAARRRARCPSSRSRCRFRGSASRRSPSPARAAARRLRRPPAAGPRCVAVARDLFQHRVARAVQPGEIALDGVRHNRRPSSVF